MSTKTTTSSNARLAPCQIRSVRATLHQLRYPAFSISRTAISLINRKTVTQTAMLAANNNPHKTATVMSRIFVCGLDGPGGSPARCLCNSWLFREFDRNQIDAAGPSTGIKLSSALPTMLPAMRTKVRAGARCRTAISKIAAPAVVEAASPSPGMSASRGSRPMRIFVPGINSKSSSHFAIKCDSSPRRSATCGRAPWAEVDAEVEDAVRYGRLEAPGGMISSGSMAGWSDISGSRRVSGNAKNALSA